MTKIWAHRGASGYAPENTLESFKRAVEMGAEGIELDVQLTKDGQLVVIHDETVDRTSDHKGFVKDIDFAEIRTYNFNNHNSEYEFCMIPTLEEVFELIKPTDMVINIELKTGVFEYPGIEEKVLELVDKYEMGDRIIYSSFNHYSVKKIRELRPESYCAFLHTDRIINIAEYAHEHQMNALHPGFWILADPRYLREARKYNLEINSWTINDEPYIYMALKLGIDAIITNYPDKVIKIRSKMLAK